MPSPKFDPWSKDKSNIIKGERIKRGFVSTDAMAAAIQKKGIRMEGQAYMRRERGRTPLTVDEAIAFAAATGMKVQDVAMLFTRIDLSEAEKDSILFSCP